jgi:hypothetical protein
LEILKLTIYLIKNLKIIPVFVVILGILIAYGCSDNKLSRPWGISDETIRAIVKSELRCDGINIIVDKVSAPQTVCDQLGGCNDYADIQLAIEGVCDGHGIKGLYVFRFYRGELGNYKGKMIKDTD